MHVSKDGTNTMVANLRAEGQNSRAEYLELMQARIDEAERIIERFIWETVPCSCGEIYTKRGLIAPDCGRCNGPDLEPAKKFLGIED